MFLIVLIFLVLTGFVAVFRFPNLTSRIRSRLRLPRFNFSKAFRNPKIKILLQDRYFFNQNNSKIAKGPLFIVLGKDTDKLYDTISKAHFDCTRDTAETWSPWATRGASEAFAILTISNAHYLFVHPTLIEKKFDENFNSRIRFLINRLCKFRRQNYIDGIIIAAHINPIPLGQKYKPTAELLDEISYNALVFQTFSKNFKIKIPLFIIEHDFSKTKDLKNSSDMSLYDGLEKIFLGFSCDFSKKPPEQKCEDYIDTSYHHFIDGFQLSIQNIMRRTENFKLGIETIYIMHDVESSNAALIQHNIRPFWNCFVQCKEYTPATFTILNSILFTVTNAETTFKNILDYLSEHGTKQIVISQELLKRRTKINSFLFVLTVSVLAFFSYSIWNANKFLITQRTKFNTAIADFTTLSESISSSLSNSEPNEALLTLQETAYKIIKSYSDVKNISFRTPFLFPSWKSDIASQLQKKYKNKFSLLFSNFLLQKYESILNERVQSKSLPPDASPIEAFAFFKDYANLLIGYNTIYNQLNSNKPEQINHALTSISKIIYENKGTGDESYDFLTTVDPQKIAAFIQSYPAIEKSASVFLKERAELYFSVLLNKNNLMSASFNLSNDITDFDNLIESLNNDNNIYSDDISTTRAAFEKSIQDYQILSKEFSDGNTKLLSSSNDFFGQEFVELMNNIKKTTIFDSQIVLDISNSANLTFESFKKQIDVLATTQDKNNFPILIVDPNSEISINPKVVSLFTGLSKFNEILATNTATTAPKTDNTLPEDLHKMASYGLTKMIWSDRKLQTAIQKNADLQTQSNLLEYDIYPESFSEYLQDYIFNSLEKYWSKALSSALILTENTNTIQDTNDPHGVVSSSAELKQIVVFLAGEHFDNVLSDFDDIYIKQVDDILKDKTELFDTKDLFGGENVDFKLWDGTNSAAFDLFHVSSDDALGAILEKQKQNLFDFYNQYIERTLKSIVPVMQERPNLRSVYYNRWYSVQLAFENKSKSYQKFSNFILTDLNKFKTDDCPNMLEASRDPGLVSDYFESRIEYLTGKLNERCRVLYMQTAVDSYDQLAKSFNQLLAGKYPFIHVDADLDSAYQSADIQDLSNILEQFQNFYKGKMAFLLRYNNQFKARVDIFNFISQMSKVNSFFHLQKNDLKTNSLSFYSIKAFFNFRSRTNEEVLANRIVDWELKIGGQSYGSLYGNLQNVQFTSNYGDQLNFTLYLAKDTALKQFNVSRKNSSRIVRNNNVTYFLKDNWALFRFIDEHKTCADTNSGCSKEKLRFEIPLENEKTLVLFCDLNLIDSDGKKTFLPAFPVTAPYLKEVSNF